MKDKKLIYHMTILVIGLALVIPGCLGLLDEFWSGMGSALLILGAVRLLRSYRLNKNEAYREKVETAITDERNRFLRNKAWAWAGYLFVLITAIGVIVFKVVGQDLLSTAASFAVCLMLVLYWGAYWILNKKY